MKKLYAWPLFLATLLCLLCLAATLSIWVAFGSPAGVMSQTGLQRARAERLSKDVLILSYRPATEHAQALSEMQDTLPLWQQTQTGLQVGNVSLGLPRHPPSDVLLAIVQTQADFTPMYVACQQILAHPSRVDQAQLQIVLDHEQGYAVAIGQVATLWQQYIDGIFWQLFWVEVSFVVAIAVLVVGNFIIALKNL